MDFRPLERDLLGDLWVSQSLWDHMTYLCDVCHGRFAGTDDERRAGDYLARQARQYDLENVAFELFEMPGWERGEARLTVLTADQAFNIPCLALPGTVGCDLEAELLDARQGSAEDYKKLGEAVAGKIVLTSADGPGRGDKYQGACEAGAAGFIFSGGKPGALAPTGSIRKDLPAIGLAYEHAEQLKRMLEAGPVRLRMVLETRVLQVTARNVVAEIPGSDPAQGWILAGGHYDGHDIAQGAQDNAAATAVLLEAARLLAPLKHLFKAGLRFVFFSGEELGLHGSYAYARDHASQLDLIRMVFNVDVVGMNMPLVLFPQASPELAAYLVEQPLSEMDAELRDEPKMFIANSDHFPFSLAGLSAVWAVSTSSREGWVHTAADTLDKVELRNLRQTAGVVARLLLRMAAEPEKLPRVRRSPEEVKKLVTDAGFEKGLRFNNRWPFDHM